jgi:two-component system, OmpR family, sensor kinase
MGRLFWKFFLFFFIVQLTTALAVGAFIQFYANDKANQERIDLSPVSQSLVEAAQSTLQFGGLDGLAQLLQRWESQNLKHHVYVVDSQNRDLLNRTIPVDLITKAAQSAKITKNTSVASVDLDGEHYLIFVATKRPERRAEGFNRKLTHEAGFELPSLRRDHPPARFNPLWRTITSFPLKALFIAAIASALFAAVLAWYFSKPIESLRLAFKQAAEGDLNVRVADKMGSRNDELSDLGQHFDYMAKRLSALMQGQSRLLHHVSHELRSPLARMQMALGLAGQNPEKVESALNRIELEAGRMDKLIGELLELSRFESGMVEITEEHFSLNDMIKTIVEDANFEASKKQIQIIANTNALIEFNGQPDLMHRAIENVVRNAVKYGTDNSVVNVICQIQPKGQWLTIEVSDQGQGVLESELDDIFKPFVRGSAGSQEVGHGVGLAITKQVTEAHGGQVIARNIKPTGFSVSLLFPNSRYSSSPDT